jgi:hypothetical protein
MRVSGSRKKNYAENAREWETEKIIPTENARKWKSEKNYIGNAREWEMEKNYTESVRKWESEKITPKMRVSGRRRKNYAENAREWETEKNTGCEATSFLLCTNKQPAPNKR